jgi:hypothetical protein
MRRWVVLFGFSVAEAATDRFFVTIIKGATRETLKLVLKLAADMPVEHAHDVAIARLANRPHT